MAKRDWHQSVSQPQYEIELVEDVYVPMRDGVKLCTDIYRPRAEGKFPALVSWSWYGKESEKLPTNPVFQPSDYIRGTGGHECGEQWYFVPRGYVQVIPDARGVGKSEGDFTIDFSKDGYDLIEWIAKQPWCNGKVGMVGMSSFAMSQYSIAAEKPPHLTAIMPFEGVTDYYRQFYYHGGIFCYLFPLHLWGLMPVSSKPKPASFKLYSEDELKKKMAELQRNPDIQCTPYLYLIANTPQMNPTMFDLMMNPYDGPLYHRVSPCYRYQDIGIPSYLGARWNGWALHLPGDFDCYAKSATPADQKKMLVVPSDNYGGMDRPFHEVQDVCLRWYDHWLKGNDTGLMQEPPITIFLQGVNSWRYEKEWPLAATQWTKFYLRGDGKLSQDKPAANEPAQVFTSDPWANPTQGFRRADSLAKADPVPRAVYQTEPLAENVEVTGPLALYWYASITSEGVPARTWKGPEMEVLEPVSNDTDWYLKVKDIDVDGAERIVAEGWLKASHYEVDESRSTPWEPYHPHTRNLPIEPGKVIRYAADLRMMSNVFLMGHRIRVEIAGQDQVQALWYHLPHMARVTHTILTDPEHASHLLLPVIPRGYRGAGEPEFPPEGPFRIPKYKRGD